MEVRHCCNDSLEILKLMKMRLVEKDKPESNIARTGDVVLFCIHLNKMERQTIMYGAQ